KRPLAPGRNSRKRASAFRPSSSPRPRNARASRAASSGRATVDPLDSRPPARSEPGWPGSPATKSLYAQPHHAPSRSAALPARRLPDAHVVNVHPLRHRGIVDALRARPVAADREVEDYVKRQVEGPGALAAGPVVENLQNPMAVHTDGDGVRPPVELVDVKFAAARRDELLGASLSLQDVIEEPRVERCIDQIRLGTDLLHDVDLTVVGPFLEVDGQHPDGGPGAAGARQLRPDLVEAVGPSGSLRNDLRRGVVLATPVGELRRRFVACLDREQALADPEVLRSSRRIILQLPVEPAF